MPRYLIKLRDEKLDRDWYLDWSTIVDAPVSYGMSREELEVYTRGEYGEAGLALLPERLKRLDDKGCSSLTGDTGEEMVEWNKAGPNQSCASIEEILEAFCRRHQ